MKKALNKIRGKKMKVREKPDIRKMKRKNIYKNELYLLGFPRCRLSESKDHFENPKKILASFKKEPMMPPFQASLFSLFRLKPPLHSQSNQDSSNWLVKRGGGKYLLIWTEIPKT